MAEDERKFTAEERQAVIATARSGVGKWRYGRGTNPPILDCSGFTMYCWLHTTGYVMPWNSAAQADYHLNPLVRTVRYSHRVRKNLRPGDLVFYYPGISHVALFAQVKDKRFHIVQATNEARDMEEIYLEQYAIPVALGFLAH